MISTIDDTVTRRAYRVHESIARFLMREHAHESAPVIVTALSYEIGRIVGSLAESSTVDELEAMIAGVATVLRTHIAAYRGGLRH
jgi:hypothetical protein